MGISKIKKIKLTHNQTAIIDAEDFSLVKDYKFWYRASLNINDTGYAVTSNFIVNGKPSKRYLHRLIMNAPKGVQVDHINGNGLDNRKSNLRLCSNVENQRNRAKKQKATSVYKGVSWAKKSNKWETCLYEKNKTIHLGFFQNERHAALAYDLWAKDIYGDFAKTNFQTI